MNALTPPNLAPILPSCANTKSINYPWQGDNLHAPGTLREIHPGFFWLRMPVGFGLEYINLWLVDEGDSWTVIDTGVGDDESAQVWRDIFAEKMMDKPVRRVIGTHMHVDHMGLAGWICKKFPGASLWMTRLEYLTMRMVASPESEPPQASIEFLSAAGWNAEQLEGYKKHYGLFSRGFRGVPYSFHRMYEGMEFEMGGERWRVIIGSGHSPEHACLYCEALNLLIAGDQILPRISSNVSVHATESEADPLADWIASCHKFRAELPADTLVLPAHNEPFFGAHARLDDLISKHEKSLRRLHKKLCAEPRRVVDCFVILFARKITGKSIGLATGEALAHLNCLMYRGLVTRKRDGDGVDWYSGAVDTVDA